MRVLGILLSLLCGKAFAGAPSLDHFQEANRARAASLATLDDATILTEEARIAPLASDLLLKVKPMIRKGGNGLQIQDLVLKQFKQNGWLPMLVGYHGYTAAVPVSVNNQVANALPSEAPFPDAALVKVELVSASDRAHVAQAWTFATPNATRQQLELLATARSALKAGIAQVRAGEPLSSIGLAIQQVLDANQAIAVHELAGYTMGQVRIQAPQVIGYKVNIVKDAPLMQVGQVLNIYVIAKSGAFGAGYQPPDFMTLLTKDGADSVMLSAMVEVTVDGPRLLSRLVD